MSSTWFTSDTHYGHTNIVRGTSKWESLERCRDFDTVEEHNNILVQNINRVVKQNDILWHMGDWSFAGKPKILEFFNRINCNNIHLILGNHDHHIAKKGTPEANLFLTVDNLLERKICGQTMVLCHYSMRTWHKGHHGSWMLYGHSHGTLPPYGQKMRGNREKELFKTMDVGIDTHKEFRPYHIDELRAIMDKRSILSAGKHGEL